MTALIPPNRKRNRSTEEEEFLPLSKKINNLHINNGRVPEHWSHIGVTLGQAHHWENGSQHWVSQCDTNQNNCIVSSHYENVAQETYHETDYQSCISYHTGQLINVDSSYTHTTSYSNSSNGENSRESTGWPTTYSPDLGVDENPFYYEKNKLLFELYIERLQRGGC